ncbi:hypothetical protein B0H17DRAFT_1144666 [Mycena rosella]|uniref:Uncharacterized protein n=1 Tax=Mycena rosella TaxID=1033263 RepID=A0AAD7CW45_MYCRO|nr:hypothetical protein B0H17DRAFT_1144666 [Mycena rosella]
MSHLAGPPTSSTTRTWAGAQDHGWEARSPTTVLGGLGLLLICLYGMAREWRVGASTAEDASSFDVTNFSALAQSPPTSPPAAHRTHAAIPGALPPTLWPTVPVIFSDSLFPLFVRILVLIDFNEFVTDVTSTLEWGALTRGERDFNGGRYYASSCGIHDGSREYGGLIRQKTLAKTTLMARRSADCVSPEFTYIAIPCARARFTRCNYLDIIHEMFPLSREFLVTILLPTGDGLWDSTKELSICEN